MLDDNEQPGPSHRSGEEGSGDDCDVGGLSYDWAHSALYGHIEQWTRGGRRVQMR
jgi:hypothetical protein